MNNDQKSFEDVPIVKRGKRARLRLIDGQRCRFRGSFVRYGTKPGWNVASEETILFSNVIHVESGSVITEHLWFNLTKGFAALGELSPGDLVEFDARVKPYTKGYVNRREWIDNRKTDYKLSHPTKIELAENTAVSEG